jgi:hypothetical protein
MYFRNTCRCRMAQQCFLITSGKPKIMPLQITMLCSPVDIQQRLVSTHCPHPQCHEEGVAVPKCQHQSAKPYDSQKKANTINVMCENLKSHVKSMNMNSTLNWSQYDSMHRNMLICHWGPKTLWTHTSSFVCNQKKHEWLKIVLSQQRVFHLQRCHVNVLWWQTYETCPESKDTSRVGW